MSPDRKPLVERVEHFEMDEPSSVPEDPDSIWRMPIRSRSQFVQIQFVAAGLAILSLAIPLVIIVPALLAVFGPRRWRWLHSNVLGYFAVGVGIWYATGLGTTKVLLLAGSVVLSMGAAALFGTCARAQYRRAQKTSTTIGRVTADSL